MIKVNLSREVITITGHANYANHGSDIVCASVSSIIYTTVNAILNFNSKSIKFVDNSSEMSITILQNSKEVKVLINNMNSLLEELKNQYPKNIKISKGE